jgi:hypothetical protein
MSEPDPFASPYQVVRLPGQQPQDPMPPMLGWPAPMPELRDGHVVRPPRPTAVTIAFWCWLAAAALVVVGLPAVLLLGVDGLAQSIYVESRDSADPMSMEAAKVGAWLTPVLFGFGFAVLSVPYVIAAAKLRGGRNWARVLLAVLGGFGLFFGLFTLAAFTGAPEWVNWLAGVVWSLLFLGCVLLGIITMFLPAANDFVRVGGRHL